MTNESQNPRGRCFCGAWLPPGDEEEGIECENCYQHHPADTLRMNAFEWDGDEWVHPEQTNTA